MRLCWHSIIGKSFLCLPTSVGGKPQLGLSLRALKDWQHRLVSLSIWFGVHVQLADFWELLLSLQQLESLRLIDLNMSLAYVLRCLGCGGCRLTELELNNHFGPTLRQPPPARHARRSCAEVMQKRFIAFFSS